MIEKIAELLASLVFRIYTRIRGERLNKNRINGTFIREALSVGCAKYKCDNALLFEYTNGETSINGRSFYYIVSHYEGRKSGLTPPRILSYEGKTPVSVLNYLDTMTEAELFRFKSVEQIPDAVTRAWVMRSGARGVVTVPLRNQANKYIAFVMLLWVETEPLDPIEYGFSSSAEAYAEIKKDLSSISKLI